MTEKLFYKDSHMQMFQAIVQECCKDGENYKIRLDRTAFFPEGGGQYADQGTLNEYEVHDVQQKCCGTMIQSRCLPIFLFQK